MTSEILSEVRVLVDWNRVGKTWIAESPDLLGLILEAANVEKLMPLLEVAIPELIRMSGTKFKTKDGMVPFKVEFFGGALDGDLMLGKFRFNR